MSSSKFFGRFDFGAITHQTKWPPRQALRTAHSGPRLLVAPSPNHGKLPVGIPRGVCVKRAVWLPWPMADDVARGGIGSLRAPC
eukprot:1351072-Prymnesium_polylepis.1